DVLEQDVLHQWPCLGTGQAVHVWYAHRAYLVLVSKPPRRDQPGARALLLENGVRGHRRAVADLLDRVTAQAGLAEHLGEALDDRLRVVLRAGGDFLAVERAVGAEQHDVGEGAADVDADAVARHQNQGQTTFSAAET